MRPLYVRQEVVEVCKNQRRQHGWPNAIILNKKANERREREGERECVEMVLPNNKTMTALNEK